MQIQSGRTVPLNHNFLLCACALKIILEFDRWDCGRASCEPLMWTTTENSAFQSSSRPSYSHRARARRTKNSYTNNLISSWTKLSLSTKTRARRLKNRSQNIPISYPNQSPRKTQTLNKVNKKDVWKNLFLFENQTKQTTRRIFLK